MKPKMGKMKNFILNKCEFIEQEKISGTFRVYTLQDKNFVS